VDVSVRPVLLAVLAATMLLVAAAPAQATIDFRSCIRDNESTATCAASAPSLSMLAGVEVGPGGNQLYTAAFNDGALQIWNRNATTGDVSFLRCFQDASWASVNRAECGSTPNDALEYAREIVISPDGRHLYVNGQAVSIFNRDAATGDLTYAGCVAPPEETSGIRDCATRHPALTNAAGIALSPDGGSLYVASAAADATLVMFERNTTSGALTAVGCFREPGDSFRCTDAIGFDGPIGVEVSADGRSVYVANRDASSVTEFARTRDRATRCPSRAASSIRPRGSRPRRRHAAGQPKGSIGRSDLRSPRTAVRSRSWATREPSPCSPATRRRAA
jgi:DNA-binding beta-propeller fold protein YncE